MAEVTRSVSIAGKETLTMDSARNSRTKNIFSLARRYIYLINLLDHDETLFYRTLEVGSLGVELHPHPVQLHIHALGDVRHQADDTERLLFSVTQINRISFCGQFRRTSFTLPRRVIDRYMPRVWR
jgi:hypothetical protein